MTDFPSSLGYIPKTAFWTAQQRDCFDMSAGKRRFAIFHEPRCGKSKIVVDTCMLQFSNPRMRLRGLLAVVWPNGGHVGWVLDAFPESFAGPWQGLVWDSQRSETVAWKQQFKELCRTDRFAVLAINAEALVSQRCRDVITDFAERRGSIMAMGDESSFMVTSSAKRTKIMHKIAALPQVTMRRILDGTPVDKKGPLDYYAQVGFLGFDILGYANEVEFKAHYAEMKIQGRREYWGAVAALQQEGLAKGMTVEGAQRYAERNAKTATIMENGQRRKLKRGRDYWTVIDEDEEGRPKFKNMDELWNRLQPFVHRATFAECFPNAQRPIFSKRYVVLSEEQRRVYGEIEEEYRSILSDGTEVSVVHHLTRMLRLQQVTSNYIPEKKLMRLHEACGGIGCEQCGETGIVEEVQSAKPIDLLNHPRLDALREELKEGRPTIVWARFIADVDAIMKVAHEMGCEPVRYDGQVSNAEKLDARQRFQEGKAGVFAANWAAASRAIPLYKAEKHVCYSNGWSFRTRKQGEERAEHGSKKFATSIVDFVSENTVDEDILNALKMGMDVSTFVLRDKPRSWI